jgi:hypothetical protein
MPNHPLRRAGIARIPLRVVILVIVALAALAATGCSDDGGTGPMELLANRRAGARAVGAWVYQFEGGTDFPGLTGAVVLADTLHVDTDGTAHWRIVADDPAGQAHAMTREMLWEMRHDSLFVFTSCSRDPRCFTTLPNWVGTFGSEGRLELRPEYGSSSLSPRVYLRPEAPR